MAWVLYLIAVPVLLVVAAVLWKADNPPGIGYLAFVGTGAMLLVIAAVDTEWYKRVPPVLAGGQMYAVLDRVQDDLRAVKGHVEKIQTGIEKIESRLEISMTDRGEGHESVTIVEITPTARTPTPEKHLP